MKKEISLAWKISFSKKKVQTLIISILSFLIIIIALSYKKTMDNYIKKDAFNTIIGRSLDVGNTRESSIEDIKNIENVSGVFDGLSGAFYISTEFVDSNKEGDIFIESANNQTIPKIYKGSNFQNENELEIICPRMFRSNPMILDGIKKIKRKELIDLTDYIGKKIKIYGISDSVRGPEVFQKKIEYEVTLKGLYENEAHSDDFQICYVNSFTAEKIYYEVNYDPEDFVPSKYNYGLKVVVDKQENISSVMKELKSKGYSVERYTNIDEKQLNHIYHIVYIILFSIAFLLLFIIIFLLKKDFVENKRFYALLKYIGYKKNDIQRINLYSDYLIIILSYVITLIIIVILRILLQIAIYYYPYILENKKIVISIKETTIVAIIILVILTVNSFAFRKKQI